jgi:glycosyltransferase involved in cell wall biosynthesis
MTGWLDQKSIQALLALSSAGLVAYGRNATQTLPNKPFEYMCSGLPLLSSLSGELERLILSERIGLQYLAGSSESLLLKLKWLSTHTEERNMMSLRARNLYLRKFSSDIIYPEFTKYVVRMARC